MAYSAVPTVATGDLWTASNHNTYIRDNFAAGVPDIFQAAGDLVYGSAADAAARLPIGANGQILSIATGLPAWGYAFPVIGYVEMSSIFNVTAYTYQDVPGLSLNITMPAAGKILAIATGVTRAQGIYDEVNMRLVIDGTANAIINQFKKYIADDQAQGNLTQIFQKSVAAGSRNIKLQLMDSSGGPDGVTMYWGNILVLGFPGA